MKSPTALLALFCASSCFAAYPVRWPAATDVRFTDGFWFDRFETNRTVTLRAALAKCEETGRLDNFRNAALARAGVAHAGFKGMWFNDAVVYKTVEGVSRVIATSPDETISAVLDSWIAAIAAAQETDGYLCTARTLGHKEGIGPKRWSAVRSSHELFMAGHLFEAAAAHFEATGKRSLLDVACRFADLLVRTFGEGEGRVRDVPGHSEVEVGLAALARVTGRGEYAELARLFVEWHGDLTGRRELYGEYAQDHLPFLEQKEAVGHAVRAAYLYAAAVDVAAECGDERYAETARRLWSDVVLHKLHLTGGIGARHAGEAFGARDELPNESAYLETCAAIGWMMFNERMFRLERDAKYLDLVERTIFNGMVSGVSLGGDEFFYPNPLASKGGYGRSAWFNVSCCPVNVLRFIPQLPQWLYAEAKGTLFWNFFASSEGTVNVDGSGVRLVQRTDYPFSGRMELAIEPSSGEQEFELKVRIPGWARGEPVPGDLYAYDDAFRGEVVLSVNGERADAGTKNGFASIRRVWRKGDNVVLELPMTVRRVRAADRVAADRGRSAVERGPVVWCAEGADNGGRVFDAVLPEDASFEDAKVEMRGIGITALRASNGLVLIPYCDWAHRGKGEMQTWFKTAD